jgi:hypothetical protein
VPFGEESTKAFALDYYKLQWERISSYEDQRMRFSSMIAAASIAGIGLLARFFEEISIEGTVLASIAFSAANILAIIFSVKSRIWIKYHQKKADNIAEELEPGLMDILKSVDKPDSDNDPFRSERLFKYLHLVLIIIP